MDQSGKVTALAIGNTIITAHAGSITATCKVTINPVTASSVTLNVQEMTLIVGQSDQLIATVYPENTTDKNVTCESSDRGVAAVNRQGLVTAAPPGAAGITVSDANGHNAFAIITVILAEDDGVETIVPEAEKLNILTIDEMLIKVKASKEDIKNLAPGIYIIGGKKVFVK